MKLSKPNFIVSTKADDLTEALKKSSQAITVWVRSGKFKDKLPLIRSAIVYEAKSISDAKDYQKRFIASFSVPKTHIKLSVLKGITNSQIFQLLSYTRGDKKIRKQTHDFDHFKTKKTFLAWKKRGKTIYTLINRNGKLLGIIWFHKGVRSIRIYPPGRGKNIVKKFSDIIEKLSVPKYC
jgi:hypothetical protein